MTFRTQAPRATDTRFQCAFCTQGVHKAHRKEG
jgi:hypothetical protein